MPSSTVVSLAALKASHLVDLSSGLTVHGFLSVVQWSRLVLGTRLLSFGSLGLTGCNRIRLPNSALGVTVQDSSSCYSSCISTMDWYRVAYLLLVVLIGIASRIDLLLVTCRIFSDLAALSSGTLLFLQWSSYLVMAVALWLTAPVIASAFVASCYLTVVISDLCTSSVAKDLRTSVVSHTRLLY